MALPRKVDLLRLHRAEYVAPRAARVITVGRGQYLAAEGRGSPRDRPFQTLVAALHRIAWALKATKRKLGKDFRVMPLEAIWWSDGGDLQTTPEAEWRWKVLVRVPNFVRGRDLAPAAAALAARGRGEGTGEVALEQLKEGRCVQALHLGPVQDQGGTVEGMIRAARAHDLTLHGRHHEIYLSDPRRVPPERLRTILRHPVRAAR